MGKDGDAYTMLLPSLAPMVSMYHAVLTLEGGDKLLSAHLAPTASNTISTLTLLSLWKLQDGYCLPWNALEKVRKTGPWEVVWGQLRPTLLENLKPEVLTLQLSASCV